MNLWRILETARDQHGERIATRGANGGRDYRQLHADAVALAERLIASGVEPGHRVALLADNVPAYLDAYFAVAGAGAILVPLNVRLAETELRRVLADADPSLLLVAPAHAARGASLVDAMRRASLPLDIVSGSSRRAAAFVPRLAGGDTPAQLYFTSGTTGRPKGVILTHRNVATHARAAMNELAIGPSDVWGHIAPLFHLADAWATFAMTLAGGRHAFLERFEPDAALALMRAEGVTLSNLVPTMIQRMLARLDAGEPAPTGLRLLLSGGAPIAPSVVGRILDRFGCDYVQTYGLTETSPYLTLSRLSPAERRLPREARLARLARTGRPFASVEVEVVRPDGASVERNDREVGEVRARGATISPGYWQDALETRAAHREGWFYTGDLATLDATGSLRIVDRRKDVILSGGETIYSIEVENAILGHPAVLECAVYGVPDDDLGERVVAAVVLGSGATVDAAALVAHCRARIGGFKLPRTIRFLPDLPRTGSGKISKRALRETDFDRD
ncbi:MAG: AMP-binding protein [Caldilineae bacterium]|nr:AMP-binding protein [Caldilineae bacterium]